jgi:hypothetical protein
MNKFFNKEDLPWLQLIWTQYYSNGKVPTNASKGSSWWRSILILLDQYKGIAQGIVGSADTTLLWKDLWNGSILCILIHDYTLLLRMTTSLCFQ